MHMLQNTTLYLQSDNQNVNSKNKYKMLDYALVLFKIQIAFYWLLPSTRPQSSSLLIVVTFTSIAEPHEKHKPDFSSLSVFLFDYLSYNHKICMS